MRSSLESLMIADLPTTPARSLLLELVAFICVGLSGMLGFIVLSNIAVALPTGLPAWFVSAFCYAVLIVPVYLLHRRFSFASDAPHAHALPRYVLVQAVALGLATLFSVVAYGVLAMPTHTASILVIALTSGVNFLVLRNWAFLKQP